MSRFSILSKILLMLFLAMNVAGCYEGFKKPNRGEGGGGGNKPGGGGASGKPYGFTVVDVIRPDEAALESSLCSRVPTTLTKFRILEMDRRQQATVEYLTSLSDAIRITTTVIGAADCSEFRAITRLANTKISPDQIPQDLKKKPSLHVRVVLWSGDRSYETPEPTIFEDEWPSIRALDSYGFKRRLSVNHFALTGPDYGYISRWKSLAGPDLSFTATTIANPSPTPEGVEAVKQTIIKSTLDFAQWLQQRQPE